MLPFNEDNKEREVSEHGSTLVSTSSCYLSYCVTEVIYWQFRIAERGHVDTMMQRCQVTWMNICQVTKMLRYKEGKMPGCQNAWIPGNKAEGEEEAAVKDK